MLVLGRLSCEIGARWRFATFRNCGAGGMGRDLERDSAEKQGDVNVGSSQKVIVNLHTRSRFQSD